MHSLSRFWTLVRHELPRSPLRCTRFFLLADLAKAGDGADALICLGDLILFLDYADHSRGIFADLFGAENASRMVVLRTALRWDEARASVVRGRQAAAGRWLRGAGEGRRGGGAARWRGAARW